MTEAPNLPEAPVKQAMEDPYAATMKDPITYEMAVTLGLWITQKQGQNFYYSNQRKYQAAGFDEEDIVAHLRWYILTLRYLTTVEKNPSFYRDQASYRSSLWVSCRRACLAHFRKHIQSLKRGLALSEGAAIPLDKIGDDGYSFQLADQGVRGRVVSEQVHKTTGHDYLDIALAWFRSGGTWEELRKLLAEIFDFYSIENLGRAIRSHLLHTIPT